MLIHVPPHATVLAMDVHARSISTGSLAPGTEVPTVDRIGTDEESVSRLLAALSGRAEVVACYEAGPTGYELARVLERAGVRCHVIAPSLIPSAPGERVKTDRRDARRLALLLRAGQLHGVRVPGPDEEAVRDLCRARGDMVIDTTRAKHRLGKFLLRHGRVFRDGEQWTERHRSWIANQRFTERAANETLTHYLATLTARETALHEIEADLRPWCDRAPFADAVHRLAAYRGITELGALTLASEVGDWRRFPLAESFMGFTGLVPSEFSSGARVNRGGITHAGNTHLRTQLVESAWAYHARPGVGPVLRRRHEGLPPEVVARAWRAQLRLCGKFRRLDSRKSNRKVVVTAVARELAGFCWAEMTA